MFKSIQWTLQLWHAGLLSAVLVGFGTASYYGISRMRYQDVDSSLEQAVQTVAARLNPGPPNGRGGGGRGGGGRPEDRRPFDPNRPARPRLRNFDQGGPRHDPGGPGGDAEGNPGDFNGPPGGNFGGGFGGPGGRGGFGGGPGGGRIWRGAVGVARTLARVMVPGGEGAGAAPISSASTAWMANLATGKMARFTMSFSASMAKFFVLQA